MTADTDLLAAVGHGLYGPRWQTDLAAAVGVNARTLRRWAAGDWPVPDYAWAAMLHLVALRAQDLDGLSDRLRRRAMPAAKPF